MAWVGAILNIVSAVVGIGGQAADGQAAAADRTAGWKLAEANMKTAGDQSAAREEAVRRESREVLGAQAAAIAESGAGLGGSNRLLMQQDAGLAELDALNVRYEGALVQRQYENEALMLKVQKPDFPLPISWQAKRARRSFDWDVEG
ncbi:hypothetical protein GVN21_20055 [Caulobacter sp. SLTY]|uniref:hypothetical protein n=1 Tax=Caulobacter sp. SLTY TaxID=2683262 RepID=UPI00141327D1|nr:hypothetical protein [Caulobacter sp. SLTY]NBB17660.1 hypothetical protein [Caulobacter sp. SLTY]